MSTQKNKENRHLLDETDLLCLQALQNNPRGTWRELSSMCAVPERTLSRRLLKLMDEGYLKVIGELHPMLYGHHSVVHAWIHVKNGQKEQLAKALSLQNNSQVVLATTGAADIFAEISVRSKQELSQLIVDDLPNMPGLSHFESRLVMRAFSRASQWRFLDANKDRHALLPNDTVTLSDEERLFAQVLAQDGRASFNHLAQTCDMSEPKAQRLLHQLLENQWLHFRVELEPALVGYQSEAILTLQTEPSQTEKIAQALAKSSMTRCLFGTTGRSQLFWHVLCPEMSDLWHISTEFLGALEGVNACDISPVIKPYKRASLLREDLKLQSLPLK